MLELSMPEHFRGFADVVGRDGGTTYAAICRGVADDTHVLSLLDAAPPAQRRPLLLLAAVHYLLLSGTHHPLSSYYDTIASGHTTAHEPRRGEVAALFAAFCAEHREELRQLIATRTTQTNEVGRCNALLLGLCHVAALDGWAAPISLLDLGASAGLNLLFDDYSYTYRAPEGQVAVTGRDGSAVKLECTLRHELGVLPELRLPTMAERVGLDVSPVDPFSDEEARWLLACQWPDNPARFGRLRAALANVRAAPVPPRLVRADMVADLDSVARTVAGDGPLVVFHSWVAAYLGEAQQRDLAKAVHGLDGLRPVHHLYFEAAAETPGLPTPPPPDMGGRADRATALVHIGPGGAPPVRLASAHPHGHWVRWWSTRSAPTGRLSAAAPARPRR